MTETPTAQTTYPGAPSGEPDLDPLGVVDLPLSMLLAAGTEEALREMIRRYQAEPTGTVAALDRLGMAGLATEWLTATTHLNGADDVRTVLAQPCLHVVARTAQRQRALDHLDALAVEHGIRPLLIKGASTARRYYAHEWLRPSSDIDVVMSAEDIERFLPGTVEFESPPTRLPHNLERRVLDRVAIEVHYRFNVLDEWGDADDLFEGAEHDAAYTALCHPSTPIAFTVALLHLRQHSGRMPWDLVDLAHIARAPAFDWNQAWTMWHERGLLPYLIGPLVLLERITGLGDTDRLRQAWQDADKRAQRHASLLFDYLSSRNGTFLKGKRLEAMVRGVPFHRFAWHALLGSPEVTARLSGRSRRDPRFWMDLAVLHPLRRVWRCFRR